MIVKYPDEAFENGNIRLVVLDMILTAELKFVENILEDAYIFLYTMQTHTHKVKNRYKYTSFVANR